MGSGFGFIDGLKKIGRALLERGNVRVTERVRGRDVVITEGPIVCVDDSALEDSVPVQPVVTNKVYVAVPKIDPVADRARKSKYAGDVPFLFWRGNVGPMLVREYERVIARVCLTQGIPKLPADVTEHDDLIVGNILVDKMYICEESFRAIAKFFGVPEVYVYGMLDAFQLMPEKAWKKLKAEALKRFRQSQAAYPARRVQAKKDLEKFRKKYPKRPVSETQRRQKLPTPSPAAPRLKGTFDSLKVAVKAAGVPRSFRPRNDESNPTRFGPFGSRASQQPSTSQATPQPLPNARQRKVSTRTRGAARVSGGKGVAGLRRALGQLSRQSRRVSRDQRNETEGE